MASHLKNISAATGNNVHEVNKLNTHPKNSQKSPEKQNYDWNAKKDPSKFQGNDMTECHFCGQNHLKRKNGNNDPSKFQGNHMTECHFCGQNHLRKKALCPAWNQCCSKYNGRNHFAAIRSKNRSHRGVHKVNVSKPQEEIDSNGDRSGSEYEFLALSH